MPKLDASYRVDSERTLVEAASSNIDPDDWKFRRLSPHSINIDLSDYTREKVISATEEVFLSSPLNKRAIDWILDFVIGPGIVLKSSDPDANRALHTFWNAPELDMDSNMRLYVQELLVYGELAFVVGVSGGRCSVTFVPSNQVEDVIEDDGLPGEVAAVKLRNGEEYSVIRWQPKARAYEGECFFFRINRLGGHLRGYPELLQLIDWIKVWESFSYNHLERASHIGGVWWDVTLEGRTEEEIDAWLVSERAVPPRPGSILAHNERVTWQLLEPRPMSRGLSNDAQFFRDFMLGAAGLTSMTDLPRNAGEAMDPVIRHLEARQKEVLSIFRTMGRFVVQEAYPGRPDLLDTVQCDVPRIGVRDVQRSAGALIRIANAIETATTNNWLDSESASRIFKELLRRMDIIAASGSEEDVGQ